MGVGEHVNWLYAKDAVLHIEQAEVAGLCGGVTAHVDDALGLGKENGVDDIIVHTGTGRVGNDDIGTAILVDELLIEDVLHVARKEERVVDAVECRVDLGVFDGFGNIFDADDLTCLARHEVGNGTCTGLEVVDQLIACKTGKLACHLIEVIGLTAVGLVE